MVLLCLIPALVAIIYAVKVQISNRSTLNFFLLCIGGFIALFNGVIVYNFFTDKPVSNIIYCVQQVTSCMIVPIAYMYFAHQMGRKRNNGTTITLWSLMAMLLIPTSLFSIDLSIPNTEKLDIEPMRLYFYVNGNMEYKTHIADVVIIVQALVTLVRMFLMGQTMRRYHLAISPNTRYFLCWWAGAIIFIIFTSIFSTDDFRKPTLLYTYFIAYSALIVAIFVLIAQNFNLCPIMLAVTNYEEEEQNTEDEGCKTKDQESTSKNDVRKTDDEDVEEIVDNVDVFLLQSKLMAERVKQMMNEKRWSDTEFTTESVIRELGTNRTYFYRMMKAEYGCTFVDLVNKHRMEHAKNLLTTTDLSILDISIACGFSDYTTFSRKFRHVYGVPPSKWKE